MNQTYLPVAVAVVIIASSISCMKPIRPRPFQEPASTDLQCTGSPENAKTRIEQLLMSKHLYSLTKQHDNSIRIYSNYQDYNGPVFGLMKKQYEARCKYMVEIERSIDSAAPLGLHVYIVTEIRPNSKYKWAEEDYPEQKDDQERLKSDFIQLLKGTGVCP